MCFQSLRKLSLLTLGSLRKWVPGRRPATEKASRPYICNRCQRRTRSRRLADLRCWEAISETEDSLVMHLVKYTFTSGEYQLQQHSCLTQYEGSQALSPHLLLCLLFISQSDNEGILKDTYSKPVSPSFVRKLAIKRIKMCEA